MENICSKTPYNLFLYNKRKQLGLSKRKMASKIGISYIRYHLIENGYIKPNKKTIDKVSKAFDIDYNDYLLDDLSYPIEIHNNKHYKIVDLFYLLLGKLWFRLIVLTLTILTLASFVTFKALDYKYEKLRPEFFSSDVNKFQDDLNMNGSISYSLYADFMHPSIHKFMKFEDNEEMLVEISSMLRNEIRLRFSITYWTDDYRFYLEADNLKNDTVLYNLEAYDYSKEYTYSDSFTLEEPDEYFLTLKEGILFSKLLDKIDFTDSFKDLINEELGYELSSFLDIYKPYMTQKNDILHKDAYFASIEVSSIILFAIFAFITFYSYMYGSKRDKEKEYSHSDKLLYLDVASNIKKRDIKFFPFIPEIVVQLFGILLIGIGVSRVLFMGFMSFEYSEDVMQTSQRLLSVQLIGVFLLSFMKFDLFIDDKRVLRNIFLYPLAFSIIYYFETYLIISLKNTNSIIFSFVNLSFPNPFMSTGCYFLIMFFLFYTPNIIKTRKKLLLFRLGAILPILFIFISFFIFYSEAIFGITIENLWIKNLFSGQRLPLSILAIVYLVGLFFLRLHFKKKYGEDNAQRYFMGNRFLFLKNIMAVLIIIVIWAFEMIFRDNIHLNKMGIGLNEFMIVIIPFILLYHPHKGKRNRFTDYFILFLYLLTMITAYIAAAIIVLLGVLTA